MGDFTVPQGDAGRLRQIARHTVSCASTIGETRRSTITTSSATVVSGLPTRRVQDFTGARDAAVKTIDAVALSLGSIGGALSAYAEALEQAQDSIRNAERDWETAHTLWLDAKRTGDADVEHRYQQQMNRHEAAADQAHQSLRDAAGTTATVLSGEVHIWVPEGAASPVQAWAAASNNILPARLRLDPHQLKNAYDRLALPKEAVANTVKLGLKGWQGWQLLIWIRSAPIAAKAEEEFAKATLACQLLKGSNPNLADPATYKANLQAEEEMLDAFGNRWPAEAIRAQKEFGFLRGILGDAKAIERLKTLYPDSATPRSSAPPAGSPASSARCARSAPGPAGSSRPWRSSPGAWTSGAPPSTTLCPWTCESHAVSAGRETSSRAARRCW